MPIATTLCNESFLQRDTDHLQKLQLSTFALAYHFVRVPAIFSNSLLGQIEKKIPAEEQKVDNDLLYCEYIRSVKSPLPFSKKKSLTSLQICSALA